MNTVPSACERLVQSRERLRLAMREVRRQPGDANRTSGESIPDWLASLKTLPGASLLLGIFQGWWVRQPLRVTLLLAAQGVKAVLQPLAQRHPYGLVIGAAAVGGLLILARPWRWISAPALWAGILPQLLAEAIKHMQSPSTTATATGHSHDGPTPQSTT